MHVSFTGVRDGLSWKTPASGPVPKQGSRMRLGGMVAFPCVCRRLGTIRAGISGRRRKDASLRRWTSTSRRLAATRLPMRAGYVGKKLPRDPEPARKPTEETMVLGAPFAAKTQLDE